MLSGVRAAAGGCRTDPAETAPTDAQISPWDFSLARGARCPQGGDQKGWRWARGWWGVGDRAALGGPEAQADGLGPAILGFFGDFFFPVKLFEQFNLGLERVSRPIPALPKPLLPAALSARAAQAKSLLAVLLRCYF